MTTKPIQRKVTAIAVAGLFGGLSVPLPRFWGSWIGWQIVKAEGRK